MAPPRHQIYCLLFIEVLCLDNLEKGNFWDLRRWPTVTVTITFCVLFLTDEQLAKRRALVAKLEANMKALQALSEAQQMRKARGEY